MHPSAPALLPSPPPGRADSDFIIEADRLGKTYGTQRALADVTVSVPPGTIGLLGPNGAGKSTFIKCLLNLETPTTGSARVLGRDIRTESRASRERIGYSPERDCHIAGMAGCEYVTYCGQLSGMPMRLARQRTHEILDLVGMGQERYRPVDTYSTGMKQRVKLAQALAHDPPLLLLDEPTNGLDPKGRRHMLELVHDLGHAQRKHVILCSHQLPDVERTCDHVVVLDKGRVIENGSIAELTRGDEQWTEVSVAGDVARFESGLGERGLAFQRQGERDFRVGVRGSDADELFAVALECGARIESVEAVRASLEDVFLRVLGRTQGAAQ